VLIYSHSFIKLKFVTVLRSKYIKKKNINGKHQSTNTKTQDIN